jgi:hypothetical protein
MIVFKNNEEIKVLINNKEIVFKINISSSISILLISDTVTTKIQIKKTKDGIEVNFYKLEEFLFISQDQLEGLYTEENFSKIKESLENFIFNRILNR